MINKRNKRALVLKESIQPVSYNGTVFQQKSQVDTPGIQIRSGRHSRKKIIDPLNQTMPLVSAITNNLKINNNPIPTTSEGTNHREMSVDDERGNNRRYNNTAGGDIIASRIVN